MRLHRTCFTTTCGWALFGLLLLLSPAHVLAQTCQYSFSDYNDVYASSDASTIYTYATVYDYSGCNHSQYTTTAKIYSPSGRTASASGPGLSAETGIAVNNEEGSYTSAVNGTFWCPVGQTYAGFGFGLTITARILVSTWTTPVSYGIDCYWDNSACVAGTPTCSTPVVAFAMSCPLFIRAAHLYLCENGNCACTLGAAISWPGPGICQ
jgi:hypothetical protein